MTAVYVIRHPQTTWNVISRYQGRLEPGLSREGEAQARLLARAFAGQAVGAVVSSPLCRALTVGRDISVATDAPLIVDQRLTEIGLGEWEGLTIDEIRARYPELLRRWHDTPSAARIPGGELLEDVDARASSALADIFRLYVGCNVVVVTHSVVVRVLAARAIGLELNAVHRLPASNAGITTLCGSKPPGRLVWLNNVSAVYQSPVAAAEAVGCAEQRGAA